MFSSTFRRSLAARPSYASRQLITPRNFQTSSRSLARKDAQDKDSMVTESNEYSKSGSDDKSAGMDDAAFNPDKTSPEEEQASAGGEADAKGVRLPSSISVLRASWSLKMR